MAEATQANETQAPPKATAVAPPRPKKALRAYLVLAGLAAAAVAAYFIHGYLTRDEVSTDDAQIDADVVPVAARVAGVVDNVAVEDNQRVDVDTPILAIDDRDYKARLDAANAELKAAQAQAAQAAAQVDIVRSSSTGGLSSAKAQLQGQGASVRTAQAQVDAAAAAVARAKAELSNAELEYDRAKKLHDAGAVSGQALATAQTTRDAFRASVDSANANLAAARDRLAASRASVAEAAGRVEQSTPVERLIAQAEAAKALAEARVTSAAAAVTLADLQREYTHIKSPVVGYVSKLAVRKGQMLQPGTVVVMVVPAKTYVVANFKETQLERIRPGDPVDISVDALGGKTFHGTVDSIAAATGARFSMMPPDNATGNFVKVVQRVPVKIKWDPGDAAGQLHAGLSVEVKVHLQH
jgi:membrane fusion protein (multidrug efflux system)